MNLPHIPVFTPPPATNPALEVPQGFTVREGVAWLGIAWEDYVAISVALAGIHGTGGLNGAVLDAREVNEGRLSLTPAEVLAKNGVDLSGGIAAFIRRANKNADQWADTPKEFE